MPSPRLLSDRQAQKETQDDERVARSSLIADDHLLFAESLDLTLDIDDRLEHVGTARNGKEAVRMVEELRPNVVLMDLDMPVMDGIDATRELQRSFQIARSSC